MKRFFVRFFVTIGALVMVYALLLVVAVVVLSRPSPVPERTILELNLETELLAYPSDDPIAQLLERDKLTLHDVVDGLEQAGNDSRIQALIANIGASALDVAQTQELRDAVMTFRSKGKKAIAFSETFGEGTSGVAAYYLASAFDEIWLQPSGDVSLTGMRAESPFVKGTLEKLGLKVQFAQRYEYKNSPNLFTEDKFTPAHREATEKLLFSIFGQIARGIAKGRKLTETQVRDLIARGPFYGREAQVAGLVDGLEYRDRVYDRAKKRAGKKSELLSLGGYVARSEPAHDAGKVIALVHGVGSVTRGHSDSDPLGGSNMGSASVSEALRSAAADRDVKAIVFRVDSPGGSYVASDTIWREVVAARKRGKPVVVSMGSVAASGGYFVAAPADKIVAQPGTITGSIGVFGGKFVTRELWTTLGVTWDHAQTSENASSYSSLVEYTPEQWTRHQAWLDRVYEDFTSKVAQGRKLPKARVLEIAKGRIWTGEDAKELGLVDELGGLHTALRLARRAAKIGDTDKVELRSYPPLKTPLERLQQLAAGGDQQGAEAVRVLTALRTLHALLPVLSVLKLLTTSTEPLSAPLPTLSY